MGQILFEFLLASSRIWECCRIPSLAHCPSSLLLPELPHGKASSTLINHPLEQKMIPGIPALNPAAFWSEILEKKKNPLDPGQAPRSDPWGENIGRFLLGSADKNLTKHQVGVSRGKNPQNSSPALEICRNFLKIPRWWRKQWRGQAEGLQENVKFC